MKNPFRLRYWVVTLLSCQWIFVVRSRTRPDLADVKLLDGPFDSTEDSARSVQFWVRQLCEPVDLDEQWCEEDDEL